MAIKKLLNQSFKVDFHLFGIVSEAPIYHIAWALNQALSINFRLALEDWIVSQRGKRKNASEHTNYHFQTDIYTYKLFQNKSTDDGTNRYFLLGDGFKVFDYLLLMQPQDEIESIIQKIRGIRVVNQVAFITLRSKKQIERFIF